MIRDVVEKVSELRDKPWLILGKGPSLDLRGCFDLDDYHVFTLNHACKVHRATAAHFTDLEALHDCWDDLIVVQGVSLPYVPSLVMPWVPHRDMGPGHFNLSELIQEGVEPRLRLLSDIDRLWSYNSTRVPTSRWHKSLTPVRVRYFSAVAAFNILGLAGCKRVYSLGVDGGVKYAKGFDPRHCLANGRTSFDIQFKEITATLERHRMTWTNLADKV